MRPDDLQRRLRDEAGRVRPSGDGLELIRHRIEERSAKRRRVRGVGMVAASVVALLAILGTAVLIGRGGGPPVEIGPVSGAGVDTDDHGAGGFDPSPHLRRMANERAWEDRADYPIEPQVCDWAANVAAHTTDARERRSAVHAAVSRQGDYRGDGLYAAVAWSCIALRCPATPDDHVGGVGIMNGEPWQGPSAHADHGPDAPWPCATNDYV